MTRWTWVRGTGIVVCVAGMLASASLVRAQNAAGTDEWVGAWRGKVQFASGALASVKDLEFLYVFNAGGTMTESSNYDGSPPVPPAYGVWRKLAPHTYEARYEFFVSKAPKAIDEITGGGGWAPAGRGVLVEKIKLAADGMRYSSTIRMDLVDAAGNPTETGSTAEVHAERIRL